MDAFAVAPHNPGRAGDTPAFTDESDPRGTPHGRPGIGSRTVLALGYVALIGVQLPVGTQLRIAIADGFVFAYLAVTSLRLRRLDSIWMTWYPATLLLIGMGLVVAFLRTGEVTFYAVFQKGIGLFVILLAMACLADYADNLARIRLLLLAFVWGVVTDVVVGVIGLAVQHAQPGALPWLNSDGVRLAALDVDPNAFGGMIACALLVVLLTARTEVALLQGTMAGVVTTVLGVGLVLTFSRSAWLAMTCGMLAAIAAVGRRAVRAFSPLLIVVVAAVPVLAVTVLPNLIQLASRPKQIDARASIISDALVEFTRSPLVGTGLGTYLVRHKVIIHNTAIWMLSELGIVGLIVFVGLCTKIALLLTSRIRTGSPPVRTLALALLAAHAAMFGLSLGIEAFYQRSWWVIFTLAGAVAAADLRSRPG